MAVRHSRAWLAFVGILALTAALVAAGIAEARITRIDITTVESPTFGGYAWPGVGQYEKIADHDD
jgi:hypothetical protein